MGAHESTTRRVSFGLDEDMKVTVIEGVKLSEDVLRWMREHRKSDSEKSSTSPTDGNKPPATPNPTGTSPTEIQEELRKDFERQQAFVQERLSRLAQKEREAAATTGVDELMPKLIVERGKVHEEQEKAKLLAKQLESKEMELARISSFYKEQIEVLEKKNFDIYKESTEQYNQAATKAEARISPRQAASVCTELQAKVLQCFRENPQQTLHCSSLAKQYMTCVQQAKKMVYRRDVGYYHQPVQGFDYAKQHLGQQGGDEETLPVSQDTLVMSLQIRDTPLSLEKSLHQDGTAHKKSLSNDKHKSKLPSEDGSVISSESEKPNSGRGSTVPKVTAQQKPTKEETRKRDDPYDTSSGSLQLISIKPVAAQPSYSHPASSDRSQDSAIVNGEVNLALKQKSDIEHYRNKLRLKAKRKGYYDFPSTDGGGGGGGGSGGGRALGQRQRHSHERAAGEHGRPLEPDDERGSTYVKSHRRHSQVGQTAYRSRQSLSSPSPGGTEMDLLVMRERPRRGIRNSGYDTEPELIEETNVDRLMGPRGYMYGRGLKGHSETSTLSSQPSIDEVRQQMHLLLEEAFSLASGGQSTSGRQSHHLHQPPPDQYSPAPPPLPYADVVTSAPGTMSCGRGGLQWVPSYGADVYQCSLPKPAFRFTQLPEMAMDSPPPLPPRTGPPPGKSLRRSTSDLGPKGRSSGTSVTEMLSHHDSNPYGPTTRAALPSITADQPLSNYSGNPITAVYAIPASRSGYSEYFLSTPPTSYHSPSWMSYPPEPEDVPPQWADSLPLPGYVEAFPHPRYPQGSPTRLPLEYKQALEQPSVAPSTASQQSLPHVGKDMDSMPLSSLSTSALVQAIRQEVAKLARKQNEMFEF